MVKFNAEKPIYSQIVDLMQIRIIKGEYPPKAKLPSVRDLATELKVNPNTVQRAFTQLEQDGCVKCERTAGRFVTDDVELIEAAKESLTQEKTKDYISCMLDYGCSCSEIIEMTQRCAQEAGMK